MEAAPWNSRPTKTVKVDVAFLHGFTYLINGIKRVPGYDEVKVHSEEETLDMMHDYAHMTAAAFNEKYSVNGVPGETIKTSKAM